MEELIMPEYYLKGLTTADNNKYQLTIEDWEKLEKAKILIDNFYTIEQKYDLLISNYSSFEKELLLQTLDSTLRTSESEFLQLVNLSSIIRETQNLIMSICLFYEQVSNRHLDKLPINEQKLSKLSHILKNMKKENLELDFIIHLRNHTAHRDIPIDSFILDNEWEKETDGNMNRLGHSIIPFISKDKLKNDKKFKKSLLNSSILVKNDKIDLRFPIRKTIAMLSNFMSVFRAELNIDLKNSDTIISRYIDKFLSFSNSSNHFCKAIYKSDEGVEKIFHLNKKQFETISFYSKRNPSQGLLEKRYVHNRI